MWASARLGSGGGGRATTGPHTPDGTPATPQWSWVVGADVPVGVGTERSGPSRPHLLRGRPSAVDHGALSGARWENPAVVRAGSDRRQFLRGAEREDERGRVRRVVRRAGHFGRQAPRAARIPVGPPAVD